MIANFGLLLLIFSFGFEAAFAGTSTQDIDVLQIKNQFNLATRFPISYLQPYHTFEVEKTYACRTYGAYLDDFTVTNTAVSFDLVDRSGPLYESSGSFAKYFLVSTVFPGELIGVTDKHRSGEIQEIESLRATPNGDLYIERVYVQAVEELSAEGQSQWDELQKKLEPSVSFVVADHAAKHWRPLVTAYTKCLLSELKPTYLLSYTFGIPIQFGTGSFAKDNHLLVAGKIEGSVLYNGLTFESDIQLYPGGRVKTGNLASDAVINDIPLTRGPISFYDQGTLELGILAHAMNIDGVKLASGRMKLSKEGVLLNGTLAVDTALKSHYNGRKFFDGTVTLKAESSFSRDSQRNVYCGTRNQPASYLINIGSWYGYCLAESIDYLFARQGNGGEYPVYIALSEFCQVNGGPGTAGPLWLNAHAIYYDNQYDRVESTQKTSFACE